MICKASERNRVHTRWCSASAVRFIGNQRFSITIENEVSTNNATAAWVRVSVSATSTSSTVIRMRSCTAAAWRSTALVSAQRRATEKELAAVDRQLARLADRVAAKHTELAEHDQSDHVGITRLTQQLRVLQDHVAAMENRWLELSEMLE